MDNVNISNIFSLSSTTSEDIFDFDSSTSKEELIDEIMPKLQQILVERFPDNPQKQKIKIYSDRISFAAPCCGDSMKDYSKKRGNIILEGKFQNSYKCHNCGTYMSLSSFFKKYNHPLSLSSISYVSSHKPNTQSTFSSDASINYLFDLNLIEQYSVTKQYLKEKLNLEECSDAEKNSAYYYLINRKQFNYSKFLYSRSDNLLFVLNLTPNNNIIGIQTRSLNQFYKGSSKYKTYNLSNIYKLLLKEEKEVPDEVNKLSMLFNSLLVNYNVPVTVVEGPMDSFLIKNCIALCGAGKHIGFDLNYRYLFDYDKTGIKHTIEMLENGSAVFLWSKLIKDYNLPKREKWDINDLVIYCYNNNIRFPNLDKYFSSDNLDLLDI